MGTLEPWEAPTLTQRGRSNDYEVAGKLMKSGRPKIRVGKVALGAWPERRSTEKMEQALSTMIFFYCFHLPSLSFQSSSLSIEVGSTVNRKGERGRGMMVAWPEKMEQALHGYEKLMKNVTQTHPFSTNFFIEKIIFCILKIAIEFFYIEIHQRLK